MINIKEGFEYLKRIDDNIKKLDMINFQIFDLQKEIFDSILYESKENNVKKLRENILSELNYYQQDIYEYKYRINKIINLYELQYTNLYNTYKDLYSEIFKNLIKYYNEEKISIYNLSLEYAKNNDFETKIEFKEKSQDYKKILQICRENLEDMLKNLKNDLYEIEIKNPNSLIKINNNLLIKIYQKFENIFRGKKKFENSLSIYENRTIPEISTKTNDKIKHIFNKINIFNEKIRDIKFKIIKRAI